MSDSEARWAESQHTQWGDIVKDTLTTATECFTAGMRAKDSLYEQRYQLLIGAVAEAVGALNDGHAGDAKRTLTNALLSARREEFPGFTDPDIVAGLTTPAVRP